MLLGKVQQPKSKSELLKCIGNLKNVDFKVMEDITRQDTPEVKRETDRFLGSHEGTVVIFRSKN